MRAREVALEVADVAIDVGLDVRLGVRELALERRDGAVASRLVARDVGVDAGLELGLLLAQDAPQLTLQAAHRGREALADRGRLLRRGGARIGEARRRARADLTQVREARLALRVDGVAQALLGGVHRERRALQVEGQLGRVRRRLPGRGLRLGDDVGQALPDLGVAGLEADAHGLGALVDGRDGLAALRLDRCIGLLTRGLELRDVVVLGGLDARLDRVARRGGALLRGGGCLLERGQRVRLVAADRVGHRVDVRVGAFDDRWGCAAEAARRLGRLTRVLVAIRGADLLRGRHAGVALVALVVGALEELAYAAALRQGLGTVGGRAGVGGRGRGRAPGRAGGGEAGAAGGEHAGHVGREGGAHLAEARDGRGVVGVDGRARRRELRVDGGDGLVVARVGVGQRRSGFAVDEAQGRAEGAFDVGQRAGRGRLDVGHEGRTFGFDLRCQRLLFGLHALHTRGARGEELGELGVGLGGLLVGDALGGTLRYGHGLVLGLLFGGALVDGAREDRRAGLRIVADHTRDVVRLERRRHRREQRRDRARHEQAAAHRWGHDGLRCRSRRGMGTAAFHFGGRRVATTGGRDDDLTTLDIAAFGDLL